MFLALLQGKVLSKSVVLLAVLFTGKKKIEGTKLAGQSFVRLLLINFLCTSLDLSSLGGDSQQDARFELS